MTTEQMDAEVKAALPQCPKIILAYFRHMVSNKGMAIIGRCDSALTARTEEGRKADITAAGVAAKSLWDATDELTKGAL